MKDSFGFARFVCLLCLFLGSFSLFGMARAVAADKEFVSRVAEVEGVKLYYTMGGHGTPRYFDPMNDPMSKEKK